MEMRGVFSALVIAIVVVSVHETDSLELSEVPERVPFTALLQTAAKASYSSSNAKPKGVISKGEGVAPSGAGKAAKVLKKAVKTATKKQVAKKAVKKAEKKMLKALPGTSVISQALRQSGQSKKERQAGRIKRGDSAAIQRALWREQKRVGMHRPKSKEGRVRQKIAVAKMAREILMKEKGMPKKLAQKILKHPSSAKKMIRNDGTLRKKATRKESTEQYFMRLLRKKADAVHVVFKTNRLKKDWLINAAEQLVRGEQGVGFQSTARKAALLVKKQQIQMDALRVSAEAKRLDADRKKRAKEAHKKKKVTKMASTVKASTVAAKAQRKSARKDRHDLRKFAKKEAKAWHKKEKVITKMKKVALSLQAERAKMAGAKKAALLAQAKLKKAKDGALVAKKSAAKAAAKALTAGVGVGKKVLAKSSTKATMKAKSTAMIAKVDASKVQKLAVMEQTEKAKVKGMRAAVKMNMAKAKLDKRKLKKDTGKMKKAKSIKRMYKAKAKVAKQLAKKDMKVARRVRKVFKKDVKKSLSRSKRIEIVSATYYCPGAVDKRTRTVMSSASILTKSKGNQNKNVRKACQGKTKCNVVVDPAKVGRAMPGCSKWAYTLKYKCVNGVKKKGKAKVKGKKAAKVVTKGKKSSYSSSSSAKGKTEFDLGEGQFTSKAVIGRGPFDDGFVSGDNGHPSKVSKNSAKKATVTKKSASSKSKKAKKTSVKVPHSKNRSKKQRAPTKVPKHSRAARLAKKTAKDQKKTIKLRSAMTELKAELSVVSPKKSGHLGKTRTKTALKADFAKLKRIVKKKLPYKQINLPAKAGARTMKLFCSPPKTPKAVKKAEKKVKNARRVARKAKRTLRKTARKKARKIARKANKEKRKAKKDLKKAKVDKSKVRADNTALKLDKQKVKELQKNSKKTVSKGSKAKLKVLLKTALKNVVKLKMKKAKAKGKLLVAKTLAKTAKKKEKKALRKIEPKKKKFKTPRAIKKAKAKIKKDKVAVKMAKKGMSALEKALRKAKSAHRVAFLIKALADEKKKISKDKHTVHKAKRKEKKLARTIARGGKVETKGQLKRREKAVVKAHTKVNAVKLQMKTASPAKATALRAALKKDKKVLKKKKRKEAKAKFRPIMKGLKLVTKIQKAAVVAGKKKSVKKATKKLSKVEDKLRTIVEALKKTNDPAAVVKYAQVIAHLKRKIKKDAKKAAKKEGKLLKAEKVKASPGKALVKIAKNKVRNAKKEILKAKLEMKQLKLKINGSSNPNKVAKAVRKLSKEKSKAKREKRAVVRRKQRVIAIKKMVKHSPKKTKKKKKSTVSLLKKSSAKVRAEVRSVRNLKIKKAVTKAKLAAAISTAMSQKEAKEKQRVKTAKADLKLRKQALLKAQAGMKITEQRQAASRKASDMVTAIKKAFLAGRYKIARQHFRRDKEMVTKKKAKHKKKRSVAGKATTKLLYNTFSPTAGFCGKGNCCMTSFSDSKCKKRSGAMCVPYNAKKPALVKWQSILSATGTFHRKSRIPTAKKTKKFKRKLDFQAYWAPHKAGQILRVRVCGKFTAAGANGATTCYPRKGGVQMGRAFSAPQGECIRSNDFASVAEKKLKGKIYGLMRSMSPKAEVKKAILKDKLHHKKKAVQKKENAKIAKAIGGVKKKKAHAKLVLLDMDDTVFLDEGVSALASRPLLSSEGSFMLTAVGNKPTDKVKKVSNISKKLPKKSGHHERDVFELA